MENKKLKGSIGNVEEEQEEKKMEEFFEIIRSFQEARKRRRTELEEIENGNSSSNSNGGRKKRIRNSSEEPPVWVPSFQLEDFKAEIEFPRPPLVFPVPCNGKEDEKQQEDNDDGLELKLGL